MMFVVANHDGGLWRGLAVAILGRGMVVVGGVKVFKGWWYGF